MIQGFAIAMGLETTEACELVETIFYKISTSHPVRSHA